MAPPPAALHDLSGELQLRDDLEAWLRDPSAAGLVTLRDSPRRRLVRLETKRFGAVLVKHFRVASGAHPLRDRIKAALGQSPATREWRVLRSLHAAGLPVPAPLALARLADGDQLLAMEFLPGRTLDPRALESGARGRRVLGAVGAVIARLHGEGWVHRDLHTENLLVHEDEVVLLDLQRARRSTSAAARLRDVGDLSFSLGGVLSTPGLLRVLEAALAVARPWDARARVRLREVFRQSARRAHDYARGRTRRSLYSGRRFARLHGAGLHGMRVREFEQQSVLAALRAHESAVAASSDAVLEDEVRTRASRSAPGGLAVVVKEVEVCSLRHRLADRFRGSAARRAWLGGRGLEVRGIGAARPLAFVESRRFGLPIASWVILEDLGDEVTADHAAGEGRSSEAVLDALRQLVVAMHRRGVDHRDLETGNVILSADPAQLAARLIDLEDVRFCRRLSDAQRMKALTQLNASLPDSFPAALRRASFARYAALLPFAAGRQRALQEIATASLARGHFWTGRDCELVRDRGRI